MTVTVKDFARSAPARDRDQFLRELLRELSGTLEENVGLEEAEGFIAIVGNRIGEMMNAEYLEAAELDTFDVEQIAAVLVDLKDKIDGGFSIESLSAERIVLMNTACPFGDYVLGRPSLCMMTSNVFGRIAALNRGYARVELDKTIAAGDGHCRVVVAFDLAHRGARGREYYA